MRLSLLLLPAGLLLGDDTFVLRQAGQADQINNAQRAARRFAPCSTFKIPNSLVALQTGVVPDASFSLQYDPKRDGEQHGLWSLDSDLRSAMRGSVVWFYQELARRAGPERMQQWVTRLDYGNKDTTESIDRFWLGQGLRISAAEQVEFLQKLHERRLPVSGRAVDTVRDLLLLETGRDYQWFGKTGACQAADHGWVGWHVGWVERGGSTAYYALNTGGTSFTDLIERRSKLVRERLASARLVAAQAPDVFTQMQLRVQRAIEEFPGTVSLSAKNIDTGKTFGIRENERVRTASTIKLPILAAIHAAAAAGSLGWDEPLTIRQQDKVSGSGIIREFAAGTKLTVRDLANVMIVVSDNTATNLLLERIGADFVNEQMLKLGLTETKSLRKVMGGSPSKEGSLDEYKRFGLGVSTPREMASLVEKLENGAVINSEASQQMLELLERQQGKDGIGRRLPADQVASKAGALDRLRSDVGVVRSAGGRIVMALTVDDMKRTDYSPENSGNVLLADLARMLVEGLAAPVLTLGTPEGTTLLSAEMDHVQGVFVDGGSAWVTWVDRKQRTGHLGVFDVASGKSLRRVELHKGEQYHPGGIDADATSVYVPVAEYRRSSSATIQKRNRKTLALEAEFATADHIGCVAVSPDRVWGGNWDSREIYEWTHDGKLISKRRNPTGTRYQDMKWRTGTLIGSGLRGDEGAIDFLAVDDLRLHRRIRAGRTSRGVLLTHEGMSIDDSRIYLLPEDGPSRLLTYSLPD